MTPPKTIAQVRDLKNMLKLRELFTGKQFNDFFNDVDSVLKELGET